ncbi:hypothetical protein POM88_043079 [Heracleum sosnowskyi]|uniref:Uncharacterized protein n=1 Tax=Heracleum sosnowskyi TaxID=360622 RepID=A0AAD8M1N6_9APIA|nr:hypothetical protein POM88_043079 [Heracleum sosnowskyi]
MYDPGDYVFQEDFRKRKNLTFRSKKHFDALISNPEKRRIYKKDVDISRVPLIFHSRGYGHGFYNLPRNDMELLDWLEESRWSLRPVVDKSGRLEIYYIEVDADKVTVEECLELLKRIDLCESRFIACSVEEPSLFCADLNKSDVTRLEGYARGHLAGAAILAYLQMRSEGIRPDEFTVGSLLASTEMLAYEVFSGMFHRNLISWNSLISGLQLNGFLMEGLLEFSELLKSEMSPNAYSFSIALSICARISALEHWKQI